MNARGFRFTPLLIAALVTVAVAWPIGHPAAASARRIEPIQVSVIDRTDGQWSGLAAAVAGWNRSPYVHLTVRPACEPGVPCAVIVVGLYGPTSWGAQTSAPGAGTGASAAYQASLVQLNLSARASFPTASQQSAVLCHELGHVLGIPHPTNHRAPVRGCIAGSDQNHVTPVASDADLKALFLARNGGPAQAWGAVVR